MQEKFKMFKDKLNIDNNTEPEISFGHIGLKDQFENYKGEFLVFSHSFLATKEDMEELEKDDEKVLNMDVEMDKFIKIFATSFLANMNISPQPYNFVTTRKPLITLKEYFNAYGNESLFENEILDDNSYVRVSLCVCYPEVLPMPEQIALDMGIHFMESFEMEELDILKIQDSYNKGVENNTLSSISSKLYYFYLNNLGDLLDMPFNSKGKVYKNNKINESPYIYETDTMLFDFLDEFDKNPILLCEMEVVIDDVNRIINAINKNY